MWTRPITPGISISQAGFGAATGGTLGCFVEDIESGKIMLLSNMHVLQFFQDAPYFSYSTAKPESQMAVVQPCTIRLKDLVERMVGTDRQAVWDKGHPPAKKPQNPSYGTFSPTTEPPPAPVIPNVEQLKAYYYETLSTRMSEMIKISRVATFARGFLDTNFDAAVATLEPGIVWSNAAPDGTQILAPPGFVGPPGRCWKYGDASGVKKWARAMVSQEKVTVPFKTFNHESSSFGAIRAEFKPLPVEFEAGNVWLLHGEAGGTFQIQGDSGSALCDAGDRLVGLMSTGGMGNQAYAIPIDAVFARLKVRFPAAPNGMT